MSMTAETLGRDLLNAAHGAAVFRRRTRVLADVVAAHVAGGASALDVGCGDGTIARGMMARRPGLSVQGIDVFLRPDVKIPACVYDGVTIPHPDKSFDWVTVVDVLHHTDDPAAVLGECARVARRGIVVKDHLRDGLAAAATLRAMDWVGNRGHGVRLPYNYLSRAEWQAAFEKLGLRVTRWDGRLGLYPLPLDLVFGRGLHFVATLAP